MTLHCPRCAATIDSREDAIRHAIRKDGRRNCALRWYHHIIWGNVVAYTSVLALVGVLLWILIDYTNVPR